MLAGMTPKYSPCGDEGRCFTHIYFTMAVSGEYSVCVGPTMEVWETGDGIYTIGNVFDAKRAEHQLKNKIVTLRNQAKNALGNN